MPTQRRPLRSEPDWQDGTILPHLQGAAAPIRQVIAAHFLRDCDHVLEIGGAGLPMTGFVTHQPLSITVIDPKIVPYEAETLNGLACRVRHIAAKFQNQALDMEPYTYGLVLLGVSLKPWGSQAAVDDNLLALVRQARIIILDQAIDLERSAPQVPQLLAASDHETLVDIDMRLEDSQIGQSGFGHRRLLVLQARHQHEAAP